MKYLLYMMKIFRNILDWFGKSNRYKHLLLGILYGIFAYDLYSAVYGGLGVSLALEFKDDQWGGRGDIIDAALTFVGVMIGFGIHHYILMAILV